MPGVPAPFDVAVHRRVNQPRSWRGRTPLRVKLVLALVVLCALGLVVSSLAANFLLRNYLFGRADTQLNAAADQTASSLDRGESQLRLGPTPSTYFVRVFDVTGASSIIESLGTQQGLEPNVSRVAASAATTTGVPHNARSVDGSIRWRVTTRPVVIPGIGPGSVLVALRMDDVDNTLTTLRVINLLAGLGVLIVLGLLGFAVVRSSLRPLREVETTAQAIAAGDLSRRVPEGDPATEVGRLSGALNAMLSQIEAAFGARAFSEAQARASEERMRRFVADASHELRTPLTSIRGFAELYRQGAVSDPADVARVMRRVEDEAARMGLLVEDLLLLARLDQQRPLERRPVDLLGIAADVAHDARALQPARVIELITTPSSIPPVVEGDDARLRQVVTNLVTNALVHTPETARVAIGVAVDGPVGVLTVADDGPGLAPDDAARIFERFYRVDSSRTRGASNSGSGLGLSIVAALVAAHGGAVDVQSRPGEGTTFRVRLPLSREGTLQPAPGASPTVTA
jgi:two-component system OmpR family sensor kinase